MSSAPTVSVAAILLPLWAERIRPKTELSMSARVARFGARASGVDLGLDTLEKFLSGRFILKLLL
jgi:hypothetical protein